MTTKIDADSARERFADLMHRALTTEERFIVERDGEPALLIMSAADFARTIAPPPEWLRQFWIEAERAGLDKLTPEEIDTEIAAARRDRRS